MEQVEVEVEGLTLRESPTTQGRTRWRRTCRRYVWQIERLILTVILYKVGSVLSNLKEMSQAMGGEIERQNKQLDKISGKTDVADVNIGRANTRTEKILKK